MVLAVGGEELQGIVQGQNLSFGEFKFSVSLRLAM